MSPWGSLHVLILQPSHRPLYLIHTFNLILPLPSAQNPWLRFRCLMFAQLYRVWMVGMHEGLKYITHQNELTGFQYLLPFLCSLSHWFSSPHLLSRPCPLKNFLPFPLHYLWFLHYWPKNTAKILLQNSYWCLQYLVSKNMHFIIWETRSHLKSLNHKVEKNHSYIFEDIISIQYKSYVREQENTWILAHVRRIKQKNGREWQQGLARNWIKDMKKMFFFWMSVSGLGN